MKPLERSLADRLDRGGSIANGHPLPGPFAAGRLGPNDSRPSPATSPPSCTPEQAPVRAARHPLRFVDVVGELEAIAELAADHRDVDRRRLAEACRRVGVLLVELRTQFVEDVIMADAQPASRI